MADQMERITKTSQYYKFCLYGFLKNLRLFDIFFLLFLIESGITYLQIGTLYAIRHITINLLEVPSGILADSWGRRTTMVLSMLFYTSSFLIFYFFKTYPFFILAMIFYGIGEAFRSGTHKAMILDYLKRNDMLAEKTRYYGSTRSWSQMGSAISSLLAMSILLFDHNYSRLFLLTALPYALNAILLWSYPDYLNRSEESEKLSLAELLAKIIHITKGLISMFRDRETIRAVFSVASYIAAFKSLKDYLQPLLKSLAVGLPLLGLHRQETRTTIIVGIIYFLIFLMTSVTSRNAWRLEKRLRSLPTAINTAYLAGIVSILLSGVLLWLNRPALAVLLFIGLYLMQNVRRPLAVSYLSEKMESKVLASGLSVESQLETVLVALTAPLLGFLVDLSGLGAGLAIIACIYLLIYPLLRVK